MHVLSHSTHFDTDDSLTLVQVLEARNFDFGHIDVQGQTILGPLSRCCQLQPLDFASNWLIRLLPVDKKHFADIHNYYLARSLFESAGGTDEQWTNLGWHDSVRRHYLSPGWPTDRLDSVNLMLDDMTFLENLAPESWPSWRYCTDRTGRNLLHIAVDPTAKSDSIYDVVKLLLIQKVDVNHLGKWGETPLMAHIRGSEDPTILKLLIENGANTDARNRLGEAALHLSVKLGKIPITKALLSYRLHRRERFQGRWVNIHVRNRKGEGVLAVGEIAQRQAWDNPGLYAKIAACKALSIDAGAIADPDLFQEWGLEESEHSVFWPIPSGRSPIEQHALYY